jgi:probable HAF family extracellular repeat protein
MKKNTRASLVSFVFTTLVIFLESAAFSQLYTIRDLGAPTDWYSEAHGINNTGAVVGEYEVTNSIAINAFLYKDGTRTNLGFLPGSPYAIAYGINETNVIVGESNVGIDTHAFAYSNGVMSDLGTLGGNFGGVYSSAHAINRSGQIVGESSTSFMQASTIHAVLYNGATKTDLGALGGNYSNANGINSLGVVVGESDIVELGKTNVHAFIYTNSLMSDLGTLGGAYSSASGINDSGIIVGEAETLTNGSSFLHAFFYQNGAMSDLGTLGGASSSARSINNSGQIVGYATDTNEVSCGFLYSVSNMVSLNNQIPAGSGWTNLVSADAISDSGQIAGSGYRADGSFHAYLLTPSGPVSIVITNPPSHAVFSAPATFVVGAAALGSSAAITNVEFLLNNNVIGNSVSIPYGTIVTNLGVGTYTLGAIASDNNGSTASNSISITVTNSGPSPVTILNPAFADSAFSFSFATDSGFTYEAQYTTPFSFSNSWVSFTNLSGSGSVVRVTNSTLGDAERYYRVSAH